MIQWYKQSAGKNDMILVGYARFSDLVVEDPFKGNYNVSGNGRSQSSLRILKLNGPQLRGLYYCAASEAHCCINPLTSTKTFPESDSNTIIHLLITS